MANSGVSRGLDPASDELRKQLYQTLDQIIEICDRNTAVPGPPQPVIQAPKYSRNIKVRRDLPINVEGLKEQIQLYRDESRIKEDFQALMNAKISDPDTPQPTPDLPGNATQRAIQQGPELTAADYDLLARARLQQLTQDADRVAKGNGLTEFASTQPQMNIPSHVRHTLEEFFEEYGVPNSAEAYMLTEALHVSAEAIDQFFKDKAEISSIVLKAGEMLQMKSLLREVQRKGRLEEMQQKARDQEIAVDVKYIAGISATPLRAGEMLQLKGLPTDMERQYRLREMQQKALDDEIAVDGMD